MLLVAHLETICKVVVVVGVVVGSYLIKIDLAKSITQQPEKIKVIARTSASIENTLAYFFIGKLSLNFYTEQVYHK